MSEKIGIRPATVVIKGKKVLLVKSKYKDGEFYLFPGGGIEFGETVEDAAIRETLEETGVKVRIKDLFHVNEYIYAKDWSKRSMTIFFTAEAIEVSEPRTNDGGKIKRVEWIELKDLSKFDIRPRRVADMVESLSDLGNSRTMYSIDYKKE